jgi:uncharacterized protein YegP (UPF0339 family)
MHVEVFKGGGKQPFYVRLRASNGRIVVTSEGYSSKDAAMKAAKKSFPTFEIRDEV